jgi:hypothetical protein
MTKQRIATLVAFVAILVVTAVAAAAKPSSSLNLVVLSSGGTKAATTAPSYGGQITFDVSTTETNRPYVNVRCYQGGVFVYDDWAAFWAGAPQSDAFTLSSGYWTGGAADCTARLVAFDKQGREQTLASTAFHVNA